MKITKKVKSPASTKYIWNIPIFNQVYKGNCENKNKKRGTREEDLGDFVPVCFTLFTVTPFNICSGLFLPPPQRIPLFFLQIDTKRLIRNVIPNKCKEKYMSFI